MEIGEIRTLKTGIFVWSTKLQSMISFDKDVIVKVCHTCIGNDDYFFGNIHEVIGLAVVPGLLEKANGEIGTLYSLTEPFEMPTSLNPDIASQLNEHKKREDL